LRICLHKVNQLGDNVVFLPVVQRLTKDFSSDGVNVFTSPIAAQLYKTCIPDGNVHPYPTEWFNSSWKRPHHLLKLVLESRAIYPDVILLPEDQGNVAHFLAATSGAKLRFGARRDFIKIRGSLTHQLEIHSGVPHALRNWNILRSLYLHLGRQLEETPPPPQLPASESVFETADFTIHPGGSLPYKRWFPERFIELANKLSKQFFVRWISDPSVEARGLDSSIDQCTTPQLFELINALRSTRVFVGNNSGPINLCSALGTPSVIFCGPSPGNWDPFWNRERILLLRKKSLTCICCDPEDRPLNRCINQKNPMACMDAWVVDFVAQQCREWLKQWASLR
jgi:ADP-heptose:LPS heptosyltransferase